MLCVGNRKHNLIWHFLVFFVKTGKHWPLLSSSCLKVLRDLSPYASVNHAVRLDTVLIGTQKASQRFKSGLAHI